METENTFNFFFCIKLRSSSHRTYNSETVPRESLKQTNLGTNIKLAGYTYTNIIPRIKRSENSKIQKQTLNIHPLKTQLQKHTNKKVRYM